MTESQRFRAITAQIKAYTKEHTVSKEAATNALIRAGIYTKSGNLKKRYDESRTD